MLWVLAAAVVAWVTVHISRRQAAQPQLRVTRNYMVLEPASCAPRPLHMRTGRAAGLALRPSPYFRTTFSNNEFPFSTLGAFAVDNSATARRLQQRNQQCHGRVDKLGTNSKSISNLGRVFS